MQNLELVSVIITTYLRPQNLLRAIDSVINQTYKNIEIIIVDDNGLGTDSQLETYSLLQEYISRGMIKYYPHEKNKNGSAARNTGYRMSKGVYVNFFDDDDEMLPDKIQKQVSSLQAKNKDFGACTCNMKIKNPHRTFLTNNKKEGNVLVELLTGKYNFNTSTILFRRSTLDILNGWDESFLRHQDFEICVRFFRQFKLALVQDALVVKYSTPNIITRNPLKAIEYREFFISSFLFDFKTTGKSNAILCFLYSELSLILLKSDYKKEGWYYVKKSFKYGLPSFYDLLKMLMYLLL